VSFVENKIRNVKLNNIKTRSITDSKLNKTKTLKYHCRETYCKKRTSIVAARQPAMAWIVEMAALTNR